MAKETPPRMRLHVRHLDDRDIADVAICLHLHREALTASWTLTFDGPAEVVMLMDRGAKIPPLLPDAALATIHVVESGSRPDEGHTLRRPVDHARLVELLHAAERAVS